MTNRESALDAVASSLLSAVRTTLTERPVTPARARNAVRDLLAFLCTEEGRTDANCRGVDRSLMLDEEIWDAIDDIEAADSVLADVIRDMAGTLHDAVSAPGVAKNFDSTPEQLLARLQ